MARAAAKGAGHGQAREEGALPAGRHMRAFGWPGVLAQATLLLGLSSIEGAYAAGSAALELESRISLGEVRGRIDHLAIDVKRGRLFVAELGNDSVGVVDLEKRKTIRTLPHLAQPQGIGYVASTDTLYVTNARDGSLHLFQGAELTPAGRIALGEDADNVRVDEAAHRIFIGYGTGALAVIDTDSRRRIADIPLKAHPESFQLDPSSERIFVNVPDAREIAVVDRETNRQTEEWRTGPLRANYPLALDESHRRVIAMFRQPAKLGVFDAQDGRMLTSLDSCRDADDVSLDVKRDRIYVSCGEGVLQTFSVQRERYADMGRVPTAVGARTSLFVPALDRLLLAVRATTDAPASVWVLRPE